MRSSLRFTLAFVGSILLAVPSAAASATTTSDRQTATSGNTLVSQAASGSPMRKVRLKPRAVKTLNGCDGNRSAYSYVVLRYTRTGRKVSKPRIDPETQATYWTAPGGRITFSNYGAKLVAVNHTARNDTTLYVRCGSSSAAVPI